MFTLFAGLLVAGCDLGGFPRSDCTPKEESLSQELAKSELLRLTPPDAKDVNHYVTKPCDDDDHVGSVGTSFSSPGSADAVRDYYRAELPGRGWTLHGEHPPFTPGQGLDVGNPELCFENSALPGVTLGIHTAPPGGKMPAANLPPEMSKELSELPPRPNFLEFRFNEQGRRCADYVN